MGWDSFGSVLGVFWGCYLGVLGVLSTRLHDRIIFCKDWRVTRQAALVRPSRMVRRMRTLRFSAIRRELPM